MLGQLAGTLRSVCRHNAGHTGQESARQCPSKANDFSARFNRNSATLEITKQVAERKRSSQGAVFYELPPNSLQLGTNRQSPSKRELTGTHIGTLGFGSRSLGHYSPKCDDLFIASNAASASSGRARTTKSSVRFTQRTFPDESIRNSAGREMSAPSRRPCTCTRSHLRITSSCVSERIGNV